MNRQNYRHTSITETTSEKEADLASLPEKEFKIKIMNMLMEKKRKMQEQWNEVQRYITDVRKEIREVKKHPGRIYKQNG